MPARRRIIPSTAWPATLGAAAGAQADYGRSDRPDWRSVNWRTHLRAVTIDGRRMHLVDIGSAPGTPLLLVHGLGGRWQNWLENIPRLARARRVVALDLPGFGRSQLPRGEISIAGYAAAIQHACDLLEIESVVLVGNSMGGAVAARTALAAPRLVERLVLVSAAAISIRNFNPAPGAALMALISRTPLGTPDGVRSAMRRRRARHLAFAALVRHPTLIETDMLTELVGGRGAPGLAAAMAAMIDGETAAELEAIEQPTLIVQGREDMLVPLADSAWLRTQIPHARLEAIEDTGHLPMVERPVRFNDLLLDFVTAP
ncbi:MAG TPA: alpha/beta fold hydrolase [Solirubrobacteraceae bacterium]